MQLKRIEVSGFRGIKRLSLTFDELTVLIGENAWGKSSLLDALSIALSPDTKFYNFKFSDFHVDYTAGHKKNDAVANRTSLERRLRRRI